MCIRDRATVGQTSRLYGYILSVVAVTKNDMPLRKAKLIKQCPVRKITGFGDEKPV